MKNLRCLASISQRQFTLCLSHGHFDHTGGVTCLEHARRPWSTTPPDAEAEVPSGGANQSMRIGMPEPAITAIRKETPVPLRTSPESPSMSASRHHSEKTAFERIVSRFLDPEGKSRTRSPTTRAADRDHKG